jgi:hypothetical protein
MYRLLCKLAVIKSILEDETLLVLIIACFFVIEAQLSDEKIFSDWNGYACFVADEWLHQFAHATVTNQQLRVSR